jgi:Ca-activated chloride channel family protein
MEFQQPAFALLILLIIAIHCINKANNIKNKNKNAFVVPIFSTYADTNYNNKFVISSNIMQFAIALLLIITMLTPVYNNSQQTIIHNVHNIMLAIDCSNSMSDNSTRQDKLYITKQAAINFINKRTTDRIGCIAFAGESITISPLTFNHSFLINKINSLKPGLLNDGTAIGVGIATAIMRLTNIEANNANIIILLTDGINNCGDISPDDAIILAQNMNIKTYTIAIKQQFDNALLKRIAKQTNAKFFQCDNDNDLENIYNEINKIETTNFFSNSVAVKTNISPIILSIAMLFFFIDCTMQLTILKYL